MIFYFCIRRNLCHLTSTTHRGNICCSAPASMNTNPEGPAIELHVLTAASRPRYCILNIIYHKRKGKKMIPPIFTEIVKGGRNLQLITALRLSPSTNLARKSSSHNICNEALLIAALESCQLCSK